MGTFVYALTVLRTVRTEGSDDAAFVPRLSVTVAFALTVVSVMALVLFLGHLARSLRVETMLRDVSDEARRTFARELPEAGSEPAPGAVALPSGPPQLVRARRSGFVTDVDGPRIAEAAERTGATVLLAHRVGDSVVSGTPIAHAWAAQAGGATGDLDVLGRALAAGVRLGFERTPDHDVAYSLRKTVDITVRALSPWSNDPTTAVHGLSHISALLGELLGCPLGATPFRDEAGELRFVLPQWSAEELLRLGIEEPIQFAGGQPAVLRRLAGLLRELAWLAPPRTLDAMLRTRLDQVAGLAEESTSIDRAETTTWQEHLGEALAGRWPVGH